ncbi:hypothetical protein [Chishuiella sp.]|uniref:hypothetical protein n=1 Tax=Chishuiella sp. TaxID=1969467 RepID=UPI0028B1CA97|nr:hypothetical protein [Chishuiella sp.]
MKKIIYIFLTILFATLLVNNKTISHKRNSLHECVDHQDKIDRGEKATFQIDNFNLLLIDECDSDIKFTPFDINFFTVFLNSFFYKKSSQLHSYSEIVYIGKSLPKYILFHSLQLDYI